MRRRRFHGRLLAWCFLMHIGFAHAEAGQAAATPTAAMRAYYDAARTKNYAALKELVSDEYVAEMAKAPFPLERLMRPLTENVAPALPEMRNERIMGSRATLEVRNHETKQWDTIRFVRQRNTWKLALHEMN